ncbi:hypothetical protein FO519_009355 [Halicephalobus sp. NKZ332]|nr:hypothetical protein FO519_009355 [Halicephalobus sp. NKZ332]
MIAQNALKNVLTLYNSRKDQEILKEQGYSSLSSGEYDENSDYVDQIHNIDVNDLELENRVPLGAGAFGAVYKCLWKTIKSNVYVAVKLFEPKSEELNNEIIRQMLYDELSALEKLANHPHIIPLLGYTLSDNVVLVFPLRINNLTRHLVARGNTISTDLLRRYCAQIADGMIFMHTKNIIHRDLKASNILVKDLYNVQISDFGLACRANEGKWGGGTLTHLAYEYIVNGENATKKGDIWAFGVTVWEIYERGQKVPYTNKLEHVNKKTLAAFLDDGKRLDKPEEIPLDLWGRIRICKFK